MSEQPSGHSEQSGEEIQQRCWIDGCGHTYDCPNLQRLSRAVVMHLEADHAGVSTELFLK